MKSLRLRWLAGSVSLLVSLLGALATASAAPIVLQGEWSLEGAEANGLLLLWKNARAGTSEESAPRSLAIALPPGSAAEAMLESPRASGATSRMSAPFRYRDLFIAALSLEPSIVKPGTGPGAVLLEARIRVTFHKSLDAKAFRAAFSSDPETPAERHLQGWIANYAQSRGFRSIPMGALAKTGSQGPSRGAGLPKKRLVIKTRGETIQALDYAALKQAGVPLSAIDPRRMRLYRDGLEMPLFIQGEGDGRWDAGDYLEFIGQRASGLNTYNSLYASQAVFILAWEGGQLGLRAPAVPVASRTGGPFPAFPAEAGAARPFRTREHLEEDVDILRSGSTSVEDVVDLGARTQEKELTDFWVWKRLGAEKDLAEIPFTLGYTPSTAANRSGGGGGSAGSSGEGNGSLTVTLNLKGITNNPKAAPDHHLKFILNGTDISLVGGVEHDAIWEGQESHTWVSPPLNPSVLKAGKNMLVIQKVNDLKTSDGQAVEVQDAYLNFMELDFPANYAVWDDKLAFSNAFGDSAGLKLFTLTGFTTPDVSLWDKQGRKLTNFRIARGGEGYELGFLDTLAGRTEYLACALDKREIPAIQLDTLDDLLDTDQGADYLVITERELLGRALDSLVRFRAKQGMRTRVVMARHIYQTFGDGGMDPEAIRRFVAYAYQNWARPAPSYLVLVGDASQSFDKGGGRTIVPFHPVNILGWGVAADDDYYAKVSGEDDLTDLAVGRIPAANPEDLSKVVHKTLLLETSRPQGHWSNKALLISGFESGFTAQNYLLQGIATANDRHYSRLDLFPGSPHYKTALQRSDFFAQLDSGFNLVSFVGHGGGAIWSDAGVLTLKALDEGRLKGEYPIGLVSSITCLTGFFEDNDARSLGEEMLRLRQGGAAGFYGAAGYISNLAGEALSAEILKAATGNAYATTGQIVTQAETMVKLRTGDAFLPIMAEFNLLGDPALGVRFPDREGDLNLDPMVLSGSANLTAEGSRLALSSGEARATVLLGDSVESDVDARISDGRISLQRTFPSPPLAVRNGKVLVHYWDAKASRILSAPFSSLDWLLDSVALDPARAAPGDSVRIRVKLSTAYAKTAFAGGVASYVMGGDQAPLFPGENQIGLESQDGIHLSSVSKILLKVPETDLAGPRLYLAFRLNVQVLDDQDRPMQSIPDLASRTYSLPLADLPRLELPAAALHLPIREKTGLWVLFHNRGAGTAQGLKIALVQDAQSPFPIADTAEYRDAVPKGGLDSLFFSLADSMLQGKRLRAFLIPAREGDLAATGTSRDTVFRLATKFLSTPEDSLVLDASGTFLTLSAPEAKPSRVFAESVLIASLPSHLSPGQGALPMTAYRIRATEFGAGRLMFGNKETSPAGKAAKSAAAPVPAWHYRDPEGTIWVRLDSIPSGDSSLRGAGFREGLYALLLNRDLTPPLIQLSSRGQTLLPDDYVPLNTPIDVVIRDGEGVDMALHPPVLASARQALDSATYAADVKAAFPTLARINFLPAHKADRDSITVTARDVSGNMAVRTLAYRMGDDLKIRNLGSYPNPFADTATFVYSLTDYCDKVELRIFSRAGRVVRSLEQRNVVGYQEMIWDGRANSGNNVANGLYFLKVTARAGDKESSQVFKLFKKQRK